MKLNKLAVVLLTVLAISFSIPAFTVQTAPTAEFVPEAMDIGPKLRDPSYTPELHLEMNEVETESVGYGGGMYWPTIYDAKIMLWYDDTSGLWLEWFYLVNYTDNVEIWMQEDFNYYAPDIDPDPRNPVEITEEQLDYYVTEFDENIYPTDTAFYGVPDHHNGSEAVLDDLLRSIGIDVPEDYYYSPTGKFIIMISNIGDEYYYDPTFPSFIAGFYWRTYQNYFDRNIFNINADFWETHLYPTATGTGFVGTTAHELQHLIHDDYSPGDEIWMDEACSTYAEYLCGYGVPWGDINWYMATPDNSLVIWGDQGPYNILADYGVVFLWAMYINDRFSDLWYPGANFLGDYVHYGTFFGLQGIDGLDIWFNFLSEGVETFDSVYHDWRIANLIHTDDIGVDGEYNYKSIDLAMADPPRQYDVKVKDFMYGTELGTTLTTLGYDTGVSRLGMYGSDYIRFDHLSKDIKGKRFMFDGDDGIELWQQIDGIWYSGRYNLGNALLYGSATINADSELTITTRYDIEEHWDYGFVQISTDGGETWTSLENEWTDDQMPPEYTVDPRLPEIIDNLPGLTGDSDGWIPMSFDLPDYEGEILIGFRYMTDWFTTEEGWYIGDAMVDGEPLELIPALTPMDFQVTLVYYRKVRGYSVLEPYEVITLSLDEFNMGTHYIERGPDDIVAIISPVGFNIGFVDYYFGMAALKWGHGH
ncbi:MAG: immune inhibitor A [Candidatus Hermodarchaeota archaeon]|nr:immune inhibitor A [Candidatus Hermodarchaeota archaeon]